MAYKVSEDIKAQHEGGMELSDSAMDYLIEQAQKADRFEEALKEICETYKDTDTTVLDKHGMVALAKYVLDLKNPYRLDVKRRG